MASVNDMTVRFSGTLTYPDNTVRYFHNQLNGIHEAAFSVDSASSHQAQAEIIDSDFSLANTWAVHYALVFIATELFNAVDYSTLMAAIVNDAIPVWPPSPTKVLNDPHFIVYHLEINLTFDDGAIAPYSITWERDEVTAHVKPDSAPTIDNWSEVLAKLIEALTL